jgi:hypothetical protein
MTPVSHRQAPGSLAAARCDLVKTSLETFETVRHRENLANRKYRLGVNFWPATLV